MTKLPSPSAKGGYSAATICHRTQLLGFPAGRSTPKCPFVQFTRDLSLTQSVPQPVLKTQPGRDVWLFHGPDLGISAVPEPTARFLSEENSVSSVENVDMAAPHTPAEASPVPQA